MEKEFIYEKDGRVFPRPAQDNLEAWYEYMRLALEDPELEGLETKNMDGYAARSCQLCIKERLNLTECCKAHPYTGETNAEGYCPNLNMKTGKCSLYNTSHYPKECRWFFCDHHVSKTGN